MEVVPALLPPETWAPKADSQESLGKGLLAPLFWVLANGSSRSIRWLWGSSTETWLDATESLNLWLFSLELLGTSSAPCLWPQRLPGGQSVLDIAPAARARALCPSACSFPAALAWQSQGLTTTLGGFRFYLPQPSDHTTDFHSLLIFAALP